jgi:hypothetical protein
MSPNGRARLGWCGGSEVRICVAVSSLVRVEQHLTHGNENDDADDRR